MSTTVGDLLVTFGIDMSKFNSELDQAENKAQNSGSKIGSALKNGFGFAAGIAGFQGLSAAIRGTIGAGMDFNSNMQTNTIGFTTMLGSAKQAQDMMQSLANFAANTPFELTQTETAAKQMLALGFAAKDVIPDLTAVGDAASGMGLGAEGINRIILALGQMKAHGTADAGDLLQLTQAGIPVWDMLSKAIGKTTAETQKMVTQGAIPANQAINIIMAGMEKRFPHMMDAQSKSFAGLMSTLHDDTDQVLGQALKPLFEWLTNTALPKLMNLINTFTSALKTGGWDAAFRSVLPASVVSTFEGFGVIVKDIFGYMQTHGPAVKALIAGIATAFLGFKIVGIVTSAISAIKGMAVAMGLLDAAMDANPIGIIIIAIAALVAAGVYLFSHWKQIAAWFSNLWNGMKNAAVSVFNAVVGFFVSIGRSIMGIWDAFVNWIKGAVKGLGIAVIEGFLWLYEHNTYFKMMVDRIIAAFKWLKDEATKIWNAIRDWFVQQWQQFVKMADTVWTGLKNFFGGIWDAIKNGVEAAWNKIVKVLGGAVMNAWNRITGQFNKLKDFFTNLWHEAVQWGENLIHSIATGISNKIHEIEDKVKNVAKTIASFLGFHSPTEKGPGSDSDTWMPNLFSMMVDGVNKSKPALHKALADAIPDLGATVNGNLTTMQTVRTENGSTNGRNSFSSRPVLVYLDGREIARGTAPHLVDEIRLETGLRI